MSPAPASTQTISSQDSTFDGIRKRVCKACDRCRLKKSKCDGSSPCSRCKADNAICVFGERKKSHDKVYPKGYVEMLQQQQAQLVAGLQEMYRRLQAGSGWGKPLAQHNGHPLTHDILAGLNLLDTPFEEDLTKLQARLISEGRDLAQRRGSFSSESDHDSSQHHTPVLSQTGLFSNNFAFDTSRPSLLVQNPPTQQQQPRLVPTQAPQQTATFNDPSLYAPEWAQALSEAVAQQRPQYGCTQAHGLQMPNDMDNLDYDSLFAVASLQQHADMQQLGALDSMDIDFSKYVNGPLEAFN